MKDTTQISSGDAYGIEGAEGKWVGQEVGVNSNIPLVDKPNGPVRIIRQFQYAFNPETVRKIQKKQIESPTTQELFNASLKQIEITLWGDGLVFDTDHRPQVIVKKKGYRIIVVCKPRSGVMVKEKPQTLQEITKSLPKKK